MQTLRKGSRGSDVRILQHALHLLEDGVFGEITEEAVKSFQREHVLVPDGIVGEKTWAKLLGQDGSVNKSRRYINEIIVHCSATPEGKDFTVADITAWHKKRGYSTIGYHYVVYRDGTVHNGRDVNLVGAHCLGHNANSIGVCYIGGLSANGKRSEDTRTAAQRLGLMTLLLQLRKLYPNARIRGHRDFAAKDCPSFDATQEYRNI